MIGYPLIIGNWKMMTTLSDAMVVLSMLKKRAEGLGQVEIVPCPPFVYLVPAKEELARAPHNLKLGAQSVFWKEQGAYTGQISIKMLKGLVDYVIVGHSEVMRWGYETLDQVSRKVNLCLDYGLTPIICLGEEHKSDHSSATLGRNLQLILKNVPKADFDKLVICYEPVWAISRGDLKTSQAASGSYAQKMASKIRQVIGGQGRILYGGSVTAENAVEFLHQDDIQGLLVGAASLKAREFLAICELASDLG